MRAPFLLLIAGLCCVRATASEAPRLVTSGPTNVSAAMDSFVYAMDPSGRYVVFASRARNLVENDDHQRRADIFVHDVQSGQTTLASVNTNGIGGGDGESSYASISSDGRYVVF